MKLAISWKLIVVVTVVAFGTGFNMYTTSVVNNAQLVAKPWVNITYSNNGKDLTDRELNALWSVISSMVYFGGFLGPFATQFLAKRIGRRYSLMIIALGNICGGLLVGLAHHFATVVMLLVGRAILGVFLSLGMGLGVIFITEIAPLEYRGAAATVLQVALGASDLAAVIVTMPQMLGTDDLWPVAFGLPIIPAIVMLVTLVFVPESPSYVYHKTMDTSKTMHSIKFFQGGSNLQKSFIDVAGQTQKDLALDNDVTFWSFLTDPTNRNPLALCVVLAIANPCSGVGAVLSYSTQIFIDCGLSPNVAIYGTVGVGLANFVTGIVMIFLIERFERRKVALCGIGGCILSLSLLSICTSLKLSINYHGRISYVSIGALVWFQASYAVFAPLTFLVPCELFNQITRSMASMISSLILWATAAVIVVTYIPFQKTVGIACSFLPFLSILLFCFIFLLVRMNDSRAIASTINSTQKDMDNNPSPISYIVNQQLTDY